ncbi:MAG: hypothetical protein J1G01_03675 [Clostridiales bacterium]|nr:hypothetical protein [Clostridiales bacterium]
MKKRPVLAIILALVMSLAAVFSFVGCGNDGKGESHPADDSFVGCLSAESYDSQDSAVRAFLTEELDGAATQTTFVKAEEGEALSEEEIAQLALGDAIDVNDIESAVHCTVTYTEEKITKVQTSADNDNKTYDLIIIKIGSLYFYYIPVMPKGGSITNSYIAMICDSSKYMNVTETTVSTTTSTVKGISVKVVLTATTKLAGDKAYLKMVLSIPIMQQTETEEYYLVTENDHLVTYAYSEYTNSWQRMGESNYTSLEQLMREEMFKFDHSYFERIDSGFKMIDGKLEQFVSDVMSGQINSAAANLTVTKGSAYYYVKDARLDEVVVKLTMKGKADGENVTVSATARTRYSNFGTTEIDLPF